MYGSELDNVMNNNINVKINNKIVLALTALFGLVTMAGYVEKSVLLNNEEMVTVGSVVLMASDRNPSEIYGGTWELMTGDAALGLGDGSNLSGTIIGSNEMLVPIPAHTHNFTGKALPTHSHNLTMYTSNGTNNSGEEAFSKHADYSSGTVTTTSSPTGTPTGTISTTGTSNVKMNVRGARMKINVWKRVD